MNQARARDYILNITALFNLLVLRIGSLCVAVVIFTFDCMAWARTGEWPKHSGRMLLEQAGFQLVILDDPTDWIQLKEVANDFLDLPAFAALPFLAWALAILLRMLAKPA